MELYLKCACSAIALVYDCTNADSFAHLELYFATIAQHGPERVAMVLVANKVQIVSYYYNIITQLYNFHTNIHFLLKG